MPLTVYIDRDFDAASLEDLLRQVEAEAREQWQEAVAEEERWAERTMARAAGILPPADLTYSATAPEVQRIWMRRLTEIVFARDSIFDSKETNA